MDVVVQLRILNGKAAGTQCSARRFPFRIGRDRESDLCLEADGVWARHLAIELQPGAGFVATTQPETCAVINGQSTDSALLRNGDLIELGAVRIRFALAPTRPRSLLLREALTWIALAVLCLGQVALIYWLTEKT